MKVKDLQFANYFLSHDIDLGDSKEDLLSYEIEINHMGEPDTVVDKQNKLVYNNPSSITKFLFTVIYNLLPKFSKINFNRETTGLAFLYRCRDYTYKDYDMHQHLSNPPLLVSFDKLSIPSFIVHEFIEPLVGTVKTHPILYIPLNYVDTCKIVYDVEQLVRNYKINSRDVTFHDFPLLVCNTKIHNIAAQLADITYRELELYLGTKKTNKVIRHLLLSEENKLVPRLLMSLKMLSGDPEFIVDFLDYLACHVDLSEEEVSMASELQIQSIAADTYLGQHIKTAADRYTPQVDRQWSQWTMLMGLIEKQLTPMRGSMWPATRNLKPHEDVHRKMVHLKERKKKKNQLNFEELLETSRDLFDHNAVEPGKLIEIMLKDNRVWKI